MLNLAPMDFLRRAVRVVLRAIVRWSRFHPIRGYAFIDGATIFPSHHADMLHAPDGIVWNDVFFNLTDEVVIEDGAAIAHQVMFLTGHHGHDEGGVVEEALSSGPITVRSGAWIASRAIILGGVEIGAGAVVGAGSVVTADVPPNELWAGNPARLVHSLEVVARDV